MTRLPRLLHALLTMPARGAALPPAPADTALAADPRLLPSPRSPRPVEDRSYSPACLARRSSLRLDSLDATPLPSPRPSRPVEDRSYLRRLATAFAVFFAATIACAQTVTWDPPSGSLARGQTSELSLVFENCTPSAEVQLPTVPGLQFGRPNQSSQTSMINFKVTSRLVLAYPVAPVSSGDRIEIPAFEVETNKGKLKVDAASFEIGEATVGRSNIPIDRVAGAALTVDPTTVWAGQVFSLKYQLLISRRFNPTNVGLLDWTPPANLYIEPWPKAEMIEANVGGDARVGIATKTRAAFKDPGIQTLPVAREPVDLATGGGGFDFFGRQSTEQYLITSTAPTITVKPLPLPAPADFQKAVGQFKFTSKVVPTTAAVGDPITWTLTLEGTGNWPEGLSLPAREVSRDFRAFQPNVQRKIKDGTLFEGTLTEDIVLMPTKPGTYTLGPVSYSYFDPVAGSYKTLRTDAVKITITAASATALAPSGTGLTPPVIQFNSDTPPQTTTPVVKSPAPELPGHLPMEPLPGHDSAPRPWAAIPLSLLLAPLGPLALLWLGLGWRRARLTDPRREQRFALAELPESIAAVAQASDEHSRAVALRNWQQLAALASGTDHAAPSAEALAAATAREFVRANAETAAIWARLWQEADAHLYGRSAKLPGDWITRATAACRTARLRRLSPFAALRPSSLWPLVLVALVFAGAPRAEAAGAAEESYRRAEFANAEQTWRAGLAITPDDWILRLNLGLAVAQQNRWSEAAAHWSSAFLAAPRDPSVRWHLALGLERAEFTQPEFAALSTGTGLAGLARLASPAEWQQLVATGSLLLSLAMATALLARHFPRRRWLGWAAALSTLVGLLAVACGFTALREYGPLAHPDAVLVWKATELRSVPTEAGEQKTEPLAAGTIALWQKSFFGWDQLLFANGQTGWTRRENLQPLYPLRPEAKP